MAAFTGMQTGGHIFFSLTPTTLSYSKLLSGLGVLEGLKGISTPKPTLYSKPKRRPLLVPPSLGNQQPALSFFHSANHLFLEIANILNNFSKWVKGAG